MTSKTTSFLVLLLAGLGLPPSARAEDKSGVRPSAIDLPSGPGSVSGLGEQFEPDLNTGSARYAVPLATPPGTAGFGPSLSLTYDSGRGNGPLGLGWSLEVGSIQRQTDRGVPRYGSSDRFLYNGQELVPLADGTWRLEVEGAFLRFRRSGPGWEVDAPSGAVMRFGVSAEARQDGPLGTFRWALEQTIDPFGNRVLYAYGADGGQLYLAAVAYNAREGAADNRVTFTYEQRADALTDHRAGFPVTTARRLAQVRMLARGKRVRRYQLTYDPSSTLSRLQAVTLFGDDDATALPPVTFGYTSFSPQHRALQQMGAAPSFSLTDPDVELTDFDGDSLPDLIHTLPGAHTVAHNLGGHWGPAERIASSPSVRLSTQGVQLADLDGNGVVDLVAKLSSGAGDFKYFPNLGQGRWEASRDFINNPPFSFEDANVRLLDVDGDGLVDALQTTAGQLYHWRNRGDGGWDPAVTTDPVAGESVLFSDPQVRLADVNGDRLVDLVRVRDGSLRYWPNMGHGRFGEGLELSGAPTLGADLARLQLADLDGDGLVDLFVARGTQLSIWLQRGDGTLSPALTLTDMPEAHPSLTVVRAADLNGSGTADIVWNTPTAAAAWQYLDLSGGVRPNLLTRVDNGLGRTIELTYTSTGAIFQEARGTSLAWQGRLPIALQVVSRILVDDGRGGSSVQQLGYSDGYYDGHERQFRGFERAVRTWAGDEHEEGSSTVHAFDVGRLDKARKGTPRFLELRGGDGRVLRKEDFVFAVRDDATGSDGRRIAHPELVRRQVEHLEGGSRPVTTRETWEYDPFGHPTLHAEWGIVEGDDVGAGSDERVTRTEYAHDLSRWLLGRPVRSWVADVDGTRLGESRTYYDGAPFEGLPLGQLGTRGVAVRTAQWVEGERFIDTRRVEHDAFGNVVATLSPRGLKRRMTFDETHTFVVHETVPTGAGEISWNATHDPGSGQVLTLLDSNGALQEARYDALKRVQSIRKPGDEAGAPSLRYRYELGAPLSRVYTERGGSGSAPVSVSVTLQDGLGRKVREAALLGTGWIVQTDTAYTPRGKSARIAQPFLASAPDAPLPKDVPSTAFHYDAAGRALLQRNPDGTTTWTVFRPLSRDEFDADDLERVRPRTSIENGLSQLIEVIERTQGASGHREELRTRYLTDPLGRVVRVTDAEDHVRTVTFDGMGRQVAANSPDTGERRTAFDDDGNPVLRTSEHGSVATSFDLFGRPLQIVATDSDGTVRTTRYHHDVQPEGMPAGPYLGALARVEDEAGEESYAYDLRGRMTATTRTLKGRTFTLGFGYDALDRMIRTTYPDGSEVEHRYDALGRVIEIPGFVSAARYDAAGNVLELSLANGVVESAEYDARQRLTRHRVIGPAEQRYRDALHVYDGRSNLLESRDSGEAPSSSRHTFDDLSRLVHADLGTHAVSLAYSHDGTLLSRDGEQATRDPLRPHAIAKLGALDLEHGPGGALVGWEGRRASYDARRQLRSVTLPAGGALSYVYDHSGRLLAQEGPDTSVLFPSRFHEVEDGRGWNHVYVGKRRLARFAASVAQTGCSAGGSGLPLVAAALVLGGLGLRRRRMRVPIALLGLLAASCGPQGLSEGTRFYHRDLIGSVVLFTDAEGRSGGHTRYDPFGRPLTETLEREQFAGGQWDARSGLVQLGARPLAVALGQWALPDTDSLEGVGSHLGRPQGLNPYAYASNNPVSYVDQTGLFEEPVHGALTYHLAKAAGFTEQQAATIALATAGVDHQAHTMPMNPLNVIWHVTTYWHFDARAPERIANHIRLGVPSLERFGMDLHTLQDVGYPGAEGPHMRGVACYLPAVGMPAQGGHPFYQNEDGSPSLPWLHNADHAHRNPRANAGLFRRMFGDLMAAARAKNGPSTTYDLDAMEAAINEVVTADSDTKIQEFLNRAPKGASRSYADVVKANSKTATGWGTDEIDSSVEP